MPTAAAIIIGDEILSGKFADENGPFLIGRLRSLGSDLRRLVTISDDLDAIAQEVRGCSERYDLVFTTGGVGPTHDDLTMEGIARAFDVPLVESDRLVSLMKSYGMGIDETTVRMSRIPQGAVLVDSPRSSYPVVRMANVWIFPGVPKLLRSKFDALADHFKGEAVHTARLYTTERESEIAQRLADAAVRHPSVDIGSYPRWGEGDFRVIITFESRDPTALSAATDELAGTLTLGEASKQV